MFQGIPNFQNLVGTLSKPTPSPMGSSIELLGQILGKDIRNGKNGLKVPQTDDKSDIIRAFMMLQGYMPQTPPVSPGAPTPATSPAAGVPAPTPCVGGQCKKDPVDLFMQFLQPKKKP